VGTSDERQQIAVNARDGLGCLRNGFPTFWSGQTGKLNVGALRKQAQRYLLELICILTPQRFQSMYCQNGNNDHIALSKPFMRSAFQKNTAQRWDHLPEFMPLDPMSVNKRFTQRNNDIFLRHPVRVCDRSM
jgi:hypothetical protein